MPRVPLNLQRLEGLGLESHDAPELGTKIDGMLPHVSTNVEGHGVPGSLGDTVDAWFHPRLPERPL